MDVERLRRDNQALGEELSQCKADKEFVWSLWKQLQTESPDIASAVDMVITREKLKQEQRDKEVVLLLSEKDKQISSLQKSLESSHQEIALASSERRTAKEKCSSSLQEMTSLRKDLQTLQVAHRKAVSEKERLKEKCSTLEESVVKEQCVMEDKEWQEGRLREEVSTLSKRIKEIEGELAQSREETSHLMSTLSVSEERCQSLQTEHSRMYSQIQRQEEEILQLREKLIQEMECSHSQRQMSHTESPPGGTGEGGVIKLLERTEAELFEVKAELKIKTEELQCLRCTHDKRLERLKWLRANYSLACEQLKTYESQEHSDGKKRAGRRRHSENALKHEDNKEVWNELTKYKSLCQQMEQDLVALEEERDTLKAKCCRNQTTISELRTCLQHEKEDIERKMAAIAVLEGSLTSLTLHEEKVEELQHCLDTLETERSQLLSRNSELEKQCAVFHQERISLESTIFQLQHELKMKNIKSLCKSTMTEPVQPPLPQKTPTSPPTEPKTPDNKSKFQSTNAIMKPMQRIPSKVTSHHQRSYSEGDMLSCHSKCTGLKSAEAKSVKFVTNSSSHQHPSVPCVQRSRRVVHSCTVRSCSTQTDSRGAGVHKCGAQEKVKRLEQRLQITLKKVANETLTRKSLIQSLREQASFSERQKEENRELSQKLQGYRVSLKAAENGRCQAEESVKKLQDRIWKLELSSTKCLEVPLKTSEKDRKELQDKCFELRSTNHSLQQTLQGRDLELSQTKKMQEKMERDLKQKRLLVEDYQKKLKQAHESEAAKDVRINGLTEKLEEALKLVSHNKQKLQLLKAQMIQQAADKEKLVSLLEKCQAELDGTIQELCSSRELGDQKLKVVNENISSLSCDLEGAKEQISSLEHQLEQRNEVVTEFRLTIQTVADELEAKYSKQSWVNSQTNTTVSGPSARMREIAHAALQLSDDDIDDFFTDHMITHTDTEFETSAKALGDLFSTITEVTRNFQPPFQREVTSELMTFLAHFDSQSN